MTDNKVILMILDGWGIGNQSKSDVIHNARTPNMDKLMEQYPNSRLLTSGENVGLPEGQMGNSEVGHLNIGSGRIVYQYFVRINKAIQDNSITQNQVLTEAMNYAKSQNKSVHFIGLVGHGGVHSSSHHLYKLCDITKDHGLNHVYIHALTDGRDTDPKSGYGFVKELEEHLEHSNGEIASLVGRYYTMDRDKRWERVKEGYDAMVHGKGKPTRNILESIQESYDSGVTDEFILPVVKVDEEGNPAGTIQEGDVVICFNFRTDRLRQITRALTQDDFPEHDMHTMNLHYITMTPYDDTFRNVKVLFDKQDIYNTLGEVIASNHKKQLRIAETEKYAHVTFFFSGGREKEFNNEKRILIPSPKVPTYDLQPEMSAPEVTEALLKELNNQEADFICLNFANGDMVGHTGDYEAIKKAIETVDDCTGKIVDASLKNGYIPIITADHGNADNAVNEDDSVNTAHSTNPVPFIIVDKNIKSVENGILADIAPTILDFYGIKPPDEMTGKNLVSR